MPSPAPVDKNKTATPQNPFAAGANTPIGRAQQTGASTPTPTGTSNPRAPAGPTTDASKSSILGGTMGDLASGFGSVASGAAGFGKRMLQGAGLMATKPSWNSEAKTQPVRDMSNTVFGEAQTQANKVAAGPNYNLIRTPNAYDPTQVTASSYITGPKAEGLRDTQLEQALTASQSPSSATAQMKSNLGQIQNSMLGQAAGARGPDRAGAKRDAMLGLGNAGMGAATSTAALAAQEAAAKQQAYTAALGNIRAGDVTMGAAQLQPQLANQNAGLTANQQNVAASLQSQIANQGAGLQAYGAQSAATNAALMTGLQAGGLQNQANATQANYQANVDTNTMKQNAAGAGFLATGLGMALSDERAKGSISSVGTDFLQAAPKYTRPDDENSNAGVGGIVGKALGAIGLSDEREKTDVGLVIGPRKKSAWAVQREIEAGMLPDVSMEEIKDRMRSPLPDPNEFRIFPDPFVKRSSDVTWQPGGKGSTVSDERSKEEIGTLRAALRSVLTSKTRPLPQSEKDDAAKAPMGDEWLFPEAKYPRTPADIFPEGARSSPYGKSTYVDGNPRGMLNQGNLDLNDRPIIRNPDGSSSTLYSMGFDDGRGGSILVPGVRAGLNRQMTDREAWEHFMRTGEHFGRFATHKDSDAYAEKIHDTAAPTVSDERAKSDVDQMDDDEIADWADAVPAATFRYKPGIEGTDDGAEYHAGTLATGLQQTGPLGRLMVHRRPDGFKEVEYGPLGMFMGKGAMVRANEALAKAEAAYQLALNSGRKKGR